jgi:uncharacterized protein YoaH (UPF0181 family)
MSSGEPMLIVEEELHENAEREGEDEDPTSSR